MREILIITGETNSGKTSTLTKIIEECKRISIKAGGILSVAEIEHGKKIRIMAKDIVTENEKLLAVMEEIPSELKTGLYSFYKETFNWCDEIIKNNFDTDVMIIDEIGRLELQKYGFYKILKIIRDQYKGTVLLTVKKKLTEDVIREFRLQKAVVKELGRDKNITGFILQRIKRSLIHVCILAGGESKRMGTSKALTILNGRRLIDHSFNIAEKISDNISIASGKCKISGFNCIIDIKGKGPMAGLYPALLEYKRVLILPCDLPFLSPGLLDYIIEQSTGCDITVPRINNIIQMQTGIYSDKCTKLIEENIKNKDYSLYNLLKSEKIKVRIIEEDEINKFGDLDIIFFNVNSPEDLIKAEKIE